MRASLAYSSVERGTLVGKSLIKTKKRIGPKCEPCGTPADIGCLVEMVLIPTLTAQAMVRVER